MNRTFTLVCCLAVGVATFAQEAHERLMHIKVRDGQTISVATRNVEEITFSTRATPQVEAAEYEYVDLGLPSGTLWAKHNIGTDKAEGFGGYYAWGEVEEKDFYKMENYAHVYGTDPDTTLRKYVCEEKYAGEGIEPDYQTTLLPEDDAASQLWGGEWHIPSREQWYELQYECRWIPSEIAGTKGYRVYGPNGSCIFLPCNGYCADTEGKDVIYSNDVGYYWTSDLVSYPDKPHYAVLYYFHEETNTTFDFFRYYGLGIRAVIDNRE